MTDGTIRSIRHSIKRTLSGVSGEVANSILGGRSGLSLDEQATRFRAVAAVVEAVSPDAAGEAGSQVEQALSIIARRQETANAEPSNSELELDEVELQDIDS